MIGTPFMPGGQKSQKTNEKPIWLQDAKDEKGRPMKFTGAFTGAWHESHVGFNGTVGSKEGFTPSEFISSRAQKAADQVIKAVQS